MRAAVAAGEARQIQKADLKAARVLEELRRVAFAQLPTLFDANQHLRPFEELSDDERSLLAAYKVTETDRGLTKEIKLWPKVQALEALARHFKLLSDLIPVAVSVNILTMTNAELKAQVAELMAKLD